MARVKKPTVREIVKKQTPILPPDFKACLRRIFENKHIQADNLTVGDVVATFKETDYWTLVQESVEYVLKTILDGSNPDLKGTPAERQLGAQIGARLVLTTILGLERTAEVINKQMDMARKQEEESKEDADAEDNVPRKQVSNVSI
jgi:hypothetical protein